MCKGRVQVVGHRAHALMEVEASPIVPRWILKTCPSEPPWPSPLPSWGPLDRGAVWILVDSAKHENAWGTRHGRGLFNAMQAPSRAICDESNLARAGACRGAIMRTLLAPLSNPLSMIGVARGSTVPRFPNADGQQELDWVLGLPRPLPPLSIHTLAHKPYDSRPTHEAGGHDLGFSQTFLLLEHGR